jgi:hypothetical protein
VPYKNKDERNTRLRQRYAEDAVFRVSRIEYGKERKRQVRALVNEHKRRCAECGAEPPIRPQWHHPNGDGDGRELSRMVSNGATVEQVRAEMARCVCLCQSCHLKLHHRSGDIGRKPKTSCPHGHPYEGDNIMWRTRPNGRRERECRACVNQRNRMRRKVMK